MKKDFSTNYPKPLAWNYELLADYVDGLVDQKTKTNIEMEDLLYSEPCSGNR